VDYWIKKNVMRGNIIPEEYHLLPIPLTPMMEALFSSETLVLA
jgi:hypothetical protein